MNKVYTTLGVLLFLIIAASGYGYWKINNPAIKTDIDVDSKYAKTIDKDKLSDEINMPIPTTQNDSTSSAQPASPSATPSTSR